MPEKKNQVEKEPEMEIKNRQLVQILKKRKQTTKMVLEEDLMEEMLRREAKENQELNPGEAD